MYLPELYQIPFTPNATVPAWGVMVDNGAEILNGQFVVKTKQATDLYYHRLYVNGPSEVASGGYGRCSLARNLPTKALFDSTLDVGDFSTGQNQWGLLPNSWKLGRGLPGFCVIGDDESADNDNDTIFVVQQLNQTIQVIAKENWTKSGDPESHYVTCNPLAYVLNNEYVRDWAYDGDTPEFWTITWPDIEIIVMLPSLAFMDPNVVTDNLLTVLCQGRVGSGSQDPRFIAISGHLDRAIGTVEFRVDNTIPQGWAIMNGTDNASGNGGSDLDWVTNNPMIRGDGATAGSGGSKHDVATGVDIDIYHADGIPIERLDNSL